MSSSTGGFDAGNFAMRAILGCVISVCTVNLHACMMAHALADLRSVVGSCKGQRSHAQPAYRMHALKFLGNGKFSVHQPIRAAMRHARHVNLENRSHCQTHSDKCSACHSAASYRRHCCQLPSSTTIICSTDLLHRESNRETPSIVAFNSKTRLMGTDGAPSMAVNPKNTVFQLKRLLGKKFNNPAVQRDIKNMPFKVVEGEYLLVLVSHGVSSGLHRPTSVCESLKSGCFEDKLALLPLQCRAETG